MAHLLVDPDGEQPRRFELRPGSNLIGRGRDCDIVLIEPSLSRQHARIEVEANRATVVDLDSRNGSFLEGVRITHCQIRRGDRLRLGDVSLIFVDDGPRSTSDARPSVLRDLIGLPSGDSALRLIDRPGRAELKLRVLLAVSEALSAPGPLAQMLETAFDLLFEVFDVDRAALLLVDESTGALTAARARALRAPTGTIWSESIVERVRAEGRGVLIRDATGDARFSAAQSVLRDAIRSAMCAPLMAGERVLGVLYVDHLRTPGRYGQEDLEFLTAFAGQAAVALENSRLYRRLEAEAVRRNSLARFFPPGVLRPLLEQDSFGQTPTDHNVTVLFSDLSGFTSMSSTMAPREVIALLNRYFPVMAHIVFQHEGTLEKYIGDALMAIWGAPNRHPDDADRALAAALEMREALERQNRESGWPPLRIHVGLNSGPVAFGNIGSPEYVQFAAIGDTTNLASRVCALAGPGEIVLAESTRRQLTRSMVALEPLPPATVKGKAEPMALYRVANP